MAMQTIMSAPPAGFADPVQQSQQAFRALLDAMARPGRIAAGLAVDGHPEGMAPALAAAILTLADYETPVWLGAGFDRPEVRDWLRFHTGAPLAARPDTAGFALLQADRMPGLDAFCLGSDAAPERGATLLVQVPVLSGVSAMVWRGPGIDGEIAMPACGLPESFWRQRAMLSSAFPRGLDLYLCCDGAVAGLPRSTAIAFREA